MAATSSQALATTVAGSTSRSSTSVCDNAPRRGQEPCLAQVPYRCTEPAQPPRQGPDLLGGHLGAGHLTSVRDRPQPRQAGCPAGYRTLSRGTLISRHLGQGARPG
ncbi:MAG: hypothetical protein ACLP53_21705, partial [Isosphaeraceae bacterium]